jgi:hypothetical protein
MTGQELVEKHRRMRSKRAKALLEERKRIMEIFNACASLRKDIRMINQITKDGVRRSLGRRELTPFKPTAENFRKAASDRHEYAKSYWNNPYDTEYYSACGYDDYQGELREQARTQAAEYFRAWRWLEKK